jgi:hypothetical protein
MGSERVAARAIDRIAWGKSRHARSDSLNRAGEINTQNRVLHSKSAQ